MRVAAGALAIGACVVLVALVRPPPRALSLTEPSATWIYNYDPQPNRGSGLGRQPHRSDVPGDQRSGLAQGELALNALLISQHETHGIFQPSSSADRQMPAQPPQPPQRQPSLEQRLADARAAALAAAPAVGGCFGSRRRPCGKRIRDGACVV
jgi:hypothetical protein